MRRASLPARGRGTGGAPCPRVAQGPGRGCVRIYLRVCSMFVLDNPPNLGYAWWRPPHEGRARGVGRGRRMRSLAGWGLARPKPQRSRDRRGRRQTGSGRPRRALLSLARAGSVLPRGPSGAARQGALSRGAVGMGQARSSPQGGARGRGLSRSRARDGCGLLPGAEPPPEFFALRQGREAKAVPRSLSSC